MRSVDGPAEGLDQLKYHCYNYIIVQENIDFAKLGMLETKKHGKGGKKSGMKGAKKAVARGSEGKGKKNPKKKSYNKGVKKNSNDSKYKEDSKEREKSPMIHVS